MSGHYKRNTVAKYIHNYIEIILISSALSTTTYVYHAPIIFQSQADGTCPVDDHKLVVMVANIAVFEQIGELLIHCKYGCSYDENNHRYTPDPARCPAKIKLHHRAEHEADCDYMPMECPNNAGVFIAID